jgi:signal transduction histidine kinase
MIFVALMNALGSGTAYAKSPNQYLLSQAYFEDTSNALTISQIEKQAFIAYKNTLTGGFKTGTFWLKLKIAASTEPLILKIRPVFTEEIELFDPAIPKGKPLVGNKHPRNESDIDSVSYSFALPGSQTDRYVYLRIKSVRSYLVNVDVMRVAEFRKIDRQELLIYTGYSTFTFLLALWLFISWLLHRELVLGAFTLQQIFAFLHTLFHGGLVKIVVDDSFEPLQLNRFFSLLVVSYPFFGILANRLLLQEYGLKKSFKLFFDFLLFISVGVIALHFYSDIPLTFSLNTVLVFSAIVFFLVAALFGVDLKHSRFQADALPINTLRIFYVFNLGLWTIAIFPLQGLIPAGELALHSLHIYSMVSGLVFFFLLQYRARTLLKLESNRATMLKAEADHERKQREEQSMLITMLSHEIKTPLSVLKLVVDEKVSGSELEGHANRAVNNIDFIIERCLQLGRIDAQATIVEKNEFTLDAFFQALMIEHKAQDRIVLQCTHQLIARSDIDILRVVASNLLENALKYSPAKSVIKIIAEPKHQNGQDGVQVEFINEIGLMGAPDPSQVFKKYYRNASATKISGSGLGLYIVFELVNVLGGSVRYQYHLKHSHEYVTFTLWIPS